MSWPDTSRPIDPGTLARVVNDMFARWAAKRLQPTQYVMSEADLKNIMDWRPADPEKKYMDRMLDRLSSQDDDDDHYILAEYADDADDNVYRLMARLDDYFGDADFGKVDRGLRAVRPEEWSTQQLVTLLTMTAVPGRLGDGHLLPSRPEFVRRAAAVLHEREGERAENLLKGIV